MIAAGVEAGWELARSDRLPMVSLCVVALEYDVLHKERPVPRRDVDGKARRRDPLDIDFRSHGQWLRGSGQSGIASIKSRIAHGLHHELVGAASAPRLRGLRLPEAQ